MLTFNVFIKSINPGRINEAEEIKTNACQFLQINRNQLDNILNAEGSCFLHGVPKEKAEDFQAKLYKIGLICICRPGQQATSLSMLTTTDIHADSSQVCPACNNKIALAADKQGTNANICSECGINIDKYLFLQKQKEEREEIKASILRTQNTKLSYERKLTDEQTEQQRKKEIENDILAELKIKKKSNFVPIIAGSSILIVVAGLSFAISNFISKSKPSPDLQVADAQQTLEQTHGQIKDPSVTNDAQSSSPSPQVTDAQEALGQTHDQAEKALNAFGLSSDGIANGSGNGKPNPSPKSQSSNAESKTSPPSSDILSASAQQELDPILTSETAVTSTGGIPTNLATNTQSILSPSSTINFTKATNIQEWDQFLTKNVLKLINNKEFSKAQALSKHIHDTETYIDAMGQLLVSESKEKNTNLVNTTLSDLQNTIQTLPSNLQPQFLAHAGLYQKLSTGSNNFTELAKSSLERLKDPEDQIVNTLKIAFYSYKAGDIEASNQYFKQINILLPKVQSNEHQISLRSAIAMVYKDVGDANIALKWLKSAKQLSIATPQKELITSYTHLNQIEPILELLKQSANPSHDPPVSGYLSPLNQN